MVFPGIQVPVKFLIDPGICIIQLLIENVARVCVPQRSLKKFMSQIKIVNCNNELNSVLF